MNWAGGARWRRGRTGARSVFVAPLFGFVLLLLFGAAGTATGEPILEEIVERVRAAAVRPQRLTFRQDVELRIFLLRWSFHADGVYDENGVRIDVHGAPRFLSPDITGSLLELSEGLDGFDLSFEGSVDEDGETFYVLQGTAKHDVPGASGGTVWVNGRTWLIERARLQYPWGSMTVEQTFQRVDGYTLLKEQVATVDRLGATLRVRYGGYSID